MSDQDHSSTKHWHLPHLPHAHKSEHQGDSQKDNHANGSETSQKTNQPVSSTTKIAIAGITGKLGRLIAKHLLAEDHVEVHGIARNPDKLPEHLKSNPRLKLFKSEMTDTSSIRDAIQGCSILISVVLSNPSAEIAMQKAMIDACVCENVPRFMPNEFTIDWRCVDLELLPMKRVNQEIFNYIDKQNGRVKGVHILIGAFMETVFSAGFIFDPSKSPAEGLSTWGEGDEEWEFTSYDNTARWTVAVALDKEATGYLKFMGDRISIKDVAKTIQDVYNTSPVPFASRGSLEELRDIVKQGIKKDPNSSNFWDWRGQSYTLFLANGEAYLEMPIDNQRYGEKVEAETLEDWLGARKLEELSKSAWTL